MKRKCIGMEINKIFGMKINYWLLGMFALASGCQSAVVENEYVVIAGKGVQEDSSWNVVVETLAAKHQATILTYRDSLGELLPQLQQVNPRYVAIVEKPENLNRDYVIATHKLSRKIDSDIYADFLWGIITGYDASNALRMVDNSTEPLVVRDAVGTIMELHSAKWFDRYAWVDDHDKGLWGEKISLADSVVTYRVEPEAVLQKFYDIYETYEPDLVVTAAHATEKNLEMPFSLGNIKCKDGVLYADFPAGVQDLKESGKRKVYFAVGNCLIGNVKNTDKSMAIAWMNSGNASAMIGYVVTTWHGRNGWGGLKYWLTTSGRYSLPEAIFLNQQDLVNQLNEWNPQLTEIDYPYDSENAFKEGRELITQVTEITPSKDQLGFVHDRDVLAYYGDPKWNVRLQTLPEENDFTVSLEIRDKKCVVTIHTLENFSLERMKGAQFKQEHVLDLPFSYFFPERMKNPRLAAGQKWKVAVDENFLLIYNADFEPGKTYTVELDID